MPNITPGPWRLGNSGAVVWATDGSPVADAFESNDRPESEYLANAHLIAAAPDMYEALNSFPMLLSPARTAWGKQVQEWQDKALAALAKADGSASNAN